MSALPTPYGSLAEADLYMASRLGTDWWTQTTVSDRNAAMVMATRAIERLNFAGDKTVSTQDLQFPRGNDTTVPTDIVCATYECALKYVQGLDIDDEIRSFGVGDASISGMRSSVNSAYVPEHLRAGIVSAEAWMYLRPYLRDPYQFSLSRA